VYIKHKGKMFIKAVNAVKRHPKREWMDVKVLAKQVGTSTYTIYAARRWMKEQEAEGAAAVMKGEVEPEAITVHCPECDYDHHVPDNGWIVMTCQGCGIDIYHPILLPMADKIKGREIRWRETNKTEKPNPKTDTQELVAEKGKVYGHPLDNFRDAQWGSAVIDKCKDDEVRFALNMIWLKICRLVETPDHKDTIDDIAGYAETIHMIHAERKRRK